MNWLSLTTMFFIIHARHEKDKIYVPKKEDNNETSQIQ